MPVAALSCAIGLNTGLLTAPAAAADQGPGAALARDFHVENVCLDAQGKALVGVSPIDGDPKCVSQRDLKPGEALTYHEREWPAGKGAEAPGAARGSDSFQVETRALGTVVVHAYDYEADTPDRAPDHYDPRTRIGGGTIAAISNTTLSDVATQLGNQGLQLFIGQGCQPGQPVGPAAMADSWVLAPLSALASVNIPPGPASGSAIIAGGLITTPSKMVDSARAICPPQVKPGSTRWYIRPVTYQAVYKLGALAGQHVRLWTLIAERTGQDEGHRDTANAFERAFFTRELGWVRWEAWKSRTGKFSNRKFAYSGAGINPRVEEAHNRVANRGNCTLPSDALQPNGSLAPADSSGAPRGDLENVGCVEVTRIIPPHSPNGDPAPTGPGTWYNSIVTGAGPGGALFAP